MHASLRGESERDERRNTNRPSAPRGEGEPGAVPAGGSDLSRLTKTQSGRGAFLPRSSSQASCQIALAAGQTLRWLADSESAKTRRNELPASAIFSQGTPGRP